MHNENAAPTRWKAACCHLEQEPVGVSLAENRTNFGIHSVFIYEIEITEIRVWQGVGGGCGHEAYKNAVVELV